MTLQVQQQQQAADAPDSPAAGAAGAVGVRGESEWEALRHELYAHRELAGRLNAEVGD